MGPGDEYIRARDLCKWVQHNNLGGLGWGIEGMVRMNAGFEMIWCNFSSPSVRLLSHLNVTAPLMLESLHDERKQEMTAAQHSLSTFKLRPWKRITDASTSLFPLPSSTERPSQPSQPSRLYPPGYGGHVALEPFTQSQF